MMHLVSHILESIRPMGSGDTVNNDISEQLHIANVKKAYRSSNKDNYHQQLLKCNDRYTGLNYM